MQQHNAKQNPPPSGMGSIKTSKWNGLNRNKRPNKYSLKKIAQLNNEVPERIKLCLRAGGKPVISTEIVKRNDGKVYEIKRVICNGGHCECGCGQPSSQQNGRLECHEKLRRSKGGVVSMRNSIMILRKCHRREDGRNPKLNWIKVE